MKDNNLISSYDDISPQPTEEGYIRLEELMAGEKPAEQRKKDNMQLMAFLLLAIFAVGLFMWYRSQYTSSYVRHFGNPITKILLKIDAKDYLEENYPDVEEDMDVDINNGIIFHTNGYMVICHDVDNHHSTITIYYDKSSQVLYDVPQLKE